MTKGSGMIHPRMATTLGFVMTDAMIAPGPLKKMLTAACERSYHRLSVDGDTSTNDMVLVAANGASGVRPDENERKVFAEVLCWVLEDLAEQIARDGEGAGKLIVIRVCGAADDDAATRIARTIANSPLVKTAVAGADPNWGRVLTAAGYAGVPFDPSKVDIHIQGIPVCRRGLAAEFSEEELKARLQEGECRIRFTIKEAGRGQSRFWTCDLTHGYIDINGSYRT
jgi:glutamate N-acetyltransferase/amino-acid N-acetyltransferase